MSLLVHVTAPSSKKDDDQRRQQAHAYLSFKCHHRHDLSLTTSDVGDPRPLERQSQLSTRDVSSYIDDTQDAVTALESQLFPSDTSSRTVTRPTQRTPQVVVHDADTAAVDHESISVSEQAVGPAPIAPSIESHWSSDEVPDQLPSTYSLTDDLSGGRESGRNSSQRHQQKSADASHGAQNSKRSLSDNIEHTRTVEEGLPTDAIASAATTINPAATSQASLTLLEESVLDDKRILHVLRDEPMFIQPPVPPTSTEPFKSHVTPALHALITNPALADRYAPKHISRQPRVSERGNWHFDTSSWTVKAQLEFWQFMTRIIQGGSIGWGVWCSRGPNMESGQTQKEHGLGYVRVFCWGEVIQHVYLLLYVASKSRIRRIPCAWLDMAENVIVQM